MGFLFSKKAGALRVHNITALISNTQQDCTRFTLSLQTTIKNSADEKTMAGISQPTLILSVNNHEMSLPCTFPSPPEKHVSPGEKIILSATATLNDPQISQERIKTVSFELWTRSKSGETGTTFTVKPKTDIGSCTVHN